MSRCLKVGSTENGFTLVEVLVSLAAMAIGFMILMGLHYSSLRMEMNDQRRVQAIEIARVNLEMLRDPGRWNGTTCPSPPPTSAQYAAAAQYTCTVSPALPSPPPSDTSVQVTVTVQWQERAKMSMGRQGPQQPSRVDLSTVFNTSHPFSPS